jgi:hypothetical protein
MVQVKIFSRNCEDRSAAYPDVAAQIREAVQGGLGATGVPKLAALNTPDPFFLPPFSGLCRHWSIILNRGSPATCQA